MFKLIAIMKRFKTTILYFAIPFFVALICFIIAIVMLILCFRFDFSKQFTVVCICVAVLLLFAFCYSTVRFVLPLHYGNQVYKHESEIMETGRVLIYAGNPGAGKTLSMTYDCLYRAECAWSDLLLDYFLGVAARKNGAVFSSEEESIYKTVCQSVEFYFSRPELIPLLISNYGIRRGNQMSANLSKEHFLCFERVPENAVWSMDESADLFSNQRSGVKEKDDKKTYSENIIISDTTSKLRHYGNWTMSFAEQDSNENQKELRRVVTINRWLLNLSKVCEPAFLQWFLSRLCQKVLKKGCETNFKLSNKIFRLRQLINKIGFFKIEYIDKGNDVASLGEQKKQDFFVLPKDLNFKYESRAYRFNYSALDSDINLEAHRSLYKND